MLLLRPSPSPSPPTSPQDDARSVRSGASSRRSFRSQVRSVRCVGQVRFGDGRGRSSWHGPGAMRVTSDASELTYLCAVQLSELMCFNLLDVLEKDLQDMQEVVKATRPFRRR